MTGAFPVIFGLADILVQGFLLAMMCGVVFLWMLHRSASDSRQLQSLRPAPPYAHPDSPRAQPYRMRSSRTQGKG